MFEQNLERRAEEVPRCSECSKKWSSKINFVCTEKDVCGEGGGGGGGEGGREGGEGVETATGMCGAGGRMEGREQNAISRICTQ